MPQPISSGLHDERVTRHGRLLAVPIGHEDHVSLRFVTRAVRAAKSKLRRNSQMIRRIVRKCSREKPHFAAGGGQPSGPWLLDQCRRTDKSWAKETFTIVTTKFSTFVTVYLSQIVSRKTERPATPV